MGLFDNVKKMVTDTADGVMKQAQNLTDSVKGINVSDSLNELSRKSGDALNGLVNGGAEALKNIQDAFAKKEEPNGLITSEDALRIFYYVMAADGTLDGSEMQKFEEIGRDVDPKFEEHKDALLTECYEKVSKETDEEFYLYTIRDCINDAIKHSQSVSGGVIHPKLLLWNLIVIAFADDEYSDAEKRILKSVIAWLNVDKAVLAEMEQTIHTLFALEREEEWLRTSNRQYAEVEKNLNEISDRKKAIMQGVQALMLD